MDDWEKFIETSLPEKEDFYSHINMEDITDVHAKRICIMICMFKAIHYC